MKKLVILCLVLLLSGCQNSNKTTSDEENYKKYEAALEALVNNGGILSEMIPFDYKAEIKQIEGQKSYNYSIVIDNPQIAMYDIEILAVDLSDLNSGELFPSSGLLSPTESMIPYQVNVDKGFPKGLILDSTTSKSELVLDVMVTWKDYAKANVYSAFFQIDLNANQEEVEVNE